MSTTGIKRLLFVDDEKSILDGFRRSYRNLREEYELFFAESGAEALAIMAQTPIDVVVSDMRMPEMDGAELMTRIAQHTPDTVRIILTGQSDRESSLKALRVTHQFLSKPCDPNDLKQVMDQALQVRERIQNPAIKKIISGLTNIPPTPRVITLLEEELSGANASAERVGEIIATDIAMTAEILKIVNSAFIGLRAPVASPQQATVVLGMETIKSLAVYLSVKSGLAPDPQIIGLSMDGIFAHSLRVATLARHLVGLEKGALQLRQDCFTAGLLHDIGKLLIMQQPSAYRDMLPLPVGAQFHQAEYARFGCSHAEVGAYLLALWKFPLPLVETIAFHHQPSDGAALDNATLGFVHVANAWINIPQPEENAFLDLAYIDAAGLATKLPGWWQASQELIAPVN